MYSWRSLSADGARNSDEQRPMTFSADDANSGQVVQGLGSALNVISNVSSFAWKPLRGTGTQNAPNIDTDYEAGRPQLEHLVAASKPQKWQTEESREENEDILDIEELMRLKKEAEETCLTATTEHLLSFIKDNPSAKYHQWIEDLHPENAHDGELLEGLDKIIDHRFFVEKSDHRRIWNENLFTFLDPVCSQGRGYVPARARYIDDNGEMVVAADILSG
jgi:hypothetical protein